MVAFALNGVIALLTALSFAEVSTRFPRSDGTYVFAKCVLSVEAAFAVGWVVWFASIVAAAAQTHLGAFGYWLVIVAAILSMLSALQANLFAASRVAAAMARDRTLPLALSRIRDASTTASDPELVQLRGRSPLVLVPIANPDNARGLVAVAHALAPPEVGRVLLLSVVVAPRDWRPGADPQPLRNTQAVLAEAITASVEAGLFPESLATVGPQPWREIARVAKVHRCESLLLGLSQLTEQSAGTPLDELLSDVDCDVVVLRAPRGWQANNAPMEEVTAHARHADLMILGLQRVGRRKKLFGQFALQIARQTACPMLLISRAR